MQELMKKLILAIADAGLTQIVYYSLHILTFVSVFVVAVWLGKRMNISVVKSILTVVILYPIMDTWKRILYWLETGVYGGENNVRIFVYVPLMTLLVAMILKINKKKLCDFVAPLMALTQGIGHFACIFAGCCKGYPVSWGIYNHLVDDYLFPIQPIEAISALLIVWYLIYRMKKRNYVEDGFAYPLMLILFGSTRFIWEFFRDNDKLVWGCSSLAFHALFMCIVGIIAVIIMKKRMATNRIKNV